MTPGTSLDDQIYGYGGTGGADRRTEPSSCRTNSMVKVLRRTLWLPHDMITISEVLLSEMVYKTVRMSETSDTLEILDVRKDRLSIRCACGLKSVFGEE